MKKIIAAAGIFALLATPGFAQQNQDAEAPAAETAQEEADAPAAPPTDEEIDASVKAINALAEDEQKVDTYCSILDEEDELKEGDTAGSDAVAKKLNDFIASLSDDAQMAFDIDETIDRTSAKGQKLGGAFLTLEDACQAEEPAEGAEEPTEG